MTKPSETQVGGDHYKAMPIQPHYFCHVNKLGALESNVVKYVCRHSRKGGKADLLKARHYIDLLLEWQYGDDGETAPPDTAQRDQRSIAEGASRLWPASLEEVRRMASAGAPLMGSEVRCVCGWSGPSGTLQRATARQHPFCPDCGADFPPVFLPGTNR